MTHKDIVFKQIRYLKGPNFWTYRPVIEAWVDIGQFEQYPSNLLPGFVDRLLTWLPGFEQHRCGVGEVGGWVARLREGTWMGHILEHTTIELQNLAGMKVGFGKARQIGDSTVYKVAVRTRSEVVGRAAIEAARELLLAAVNDAPYDLKATRERLSALVDRHCLGPSTACIVDAAVERKIPWISLNGGNLIQLGHGVRQRRIWTAETDRTSAIAEGIASDKDMTKDLLRRVGVPVPEGRVVDSPEDAWDAAQDIGLPVAVKPVDGNHGRGITLELYERADIEAAYRLADAEGSAVMVERYVVGNEHRLLMVGGKVAAAAHGETAYVVGDGKHTVQQLLDLQINADPRRGVTEEFPLSILKIEDDAVVALDLQRQGLSATAVPEFGRRVLIQRNGNVAFDCTREVHPEVAALCSLATRVVGLDIAGIDLVAQDISRPLAEQGGAIVEINAGPGLLAHLHPANDVEPAPVGQTIVDYLFPEGERGRIRIVGVCGSRATRVSELAAWLLRVSGKRVGLACRDGLFLNRRRIHKGSALKFDVAQTLLMNRTLDSAVFETDAAQILDEGLPYDRCRIGVVTDLGDLATVAHHAIGDAEHLARVVRTQVDVILKDGIAVLNAADEHVAALHELVDGETIYYGSARDLAALQAHDGRSVLHVDGNIVLRNGGEEELLDSVEALSAGGELLPGDDLAAAVAVGWAHGMTAELIRAGIKTYAADHRAAVI
jgi:cyanophycin synthetase